MNRLYGILTAWTNTQSAEYDKRYDQIKYDANMLEMVGKLMQRVPAAKVGLFACYVCNAVLGTMFADEILELDPDNTYTEPQTPAGGADLSAYTLHDTMPTAFYSSELLRYLDGDILDRLTVPTCLDVVAGTCLQLLRRSVNG